MTELLESAFEKVSKMPEIEQNIFAKFILEELESEKKWEKAFASSENVLAKLASEALEDFENSRCEIVK